MGELERLRLFYALWRKFHAAGRKNAPEEVMKDLAQRLVDASKEIDEMVQDA
jgi:hypothetical protein